MLFYETLEEYVAGEKDKLERLSEANLPEIGIVLKVLSPDENQDKKANVETYSVTREVDTIEIDSLGILGDRHRALHRPSTVRERDIYKRGTSIRQNRQVFAVSPYDCQYISDALGVEITPELLGANIVIGREDGQIHSLSALPINTNLLFGSAEDTEPQKPPIATLVNYARQQGCGITGNVLAAVYGDKTLTQRFIEVSKDNRGIVCSVEHPVESLAIIRPGQRVFFRFPMGVVP